MARADNNPALPLHLANGHRKALITPAAAGRMQTVRNLPSPLSIRAATKKYLTLEDVEQQKEILEDMNRPAAATMCTTWIDRMRKEYGEAANLSKEYLGKEPPARLLGWAVRTMVRNYYHMMREAILEKTVPDGLYAFACHVPDVASLVAFLHGSTPVSLFASSSPPYVCADDPEATDLPSGSFLFSFCVCRNDTVAHRLIVRLPKNPAELARGPDMAELRRGHRNTRRQMAAAGGRRHMSDRDALLAMQGKCNVCKQDASSRCSACHQVYYCSGEHQKSDWKFHKVTCIMTRAQRDKSSAAEALKAAGVTEEEKRMALNAMALETVTMPSGHSATMLRFRK